MDSLAISEEIRQLARRLLESGEVEVIVGFRKTADKKGGFLLYPAFIRTVKDVDLLTLDSGAVFNLSVYLIRDDNLRRIISCSEDKAASTSKVAIFLSPSGIRSVNVLASENQIRADRIFIIGYRIGDDGGIELLEGNSVDKFSSIIEEEQRQFLAEEGRQDSIELKGPDERFLYWKEQFRKCIRCYACREVCPMCYCSQCIVDQNRPQWINPSRHLLGSFEWNIVRAFHLAGRCVGCGNCERACPVGIPLASINKRLLRDVYSFFGYFPGRSPAQEPLFASFSEGDPEGFIR